MPRLYEYFRCNTKFLRDADEIRLVPFEEADESRKKLCFPGSAAKLVCPDSGQVDEPLSPSRVTKRCRKRGKGNNLRVGWRISKQGLTIGRN